MYPRPKAPVRPTMAERAGVLEGGAFGMDTAAVTHPHRERGWNPNSGFPTHGYGHWTGAIVIGNSGTSAHAYGVVISLYEAPYVGDLSLR